jgi:hypothetical protein
MSHKSKSASPEGPAAAKAGHPNPTTAQSLGALLKSARDIMRKDKGLNGDLDRLPKPRSAAVPGCEFEHRPGACSFRSIDIHRRRDAATTRSLGRLRYNSPHTGHARR